MFQKTPEEREAIKAAKKAYKREQTLDRAYYKDMLEEHVVARPQAIMTGIMPGEHEITDWEYPVHWGYAYVIKCDQFPEGRVIISPIIGRAIQLIRDLEDNNKYTNITLFTCKLGARNLF